MHENLMNTQSKQKGIKQRITSSLSALRARITGRYSDKTIRLFILIGVIVELLIIIAVSFFRGSFVSVLSDAFDATSLGGPVNFIYDKIGIDGSLSGLEDSWLF